MNILLFGKNGQIGRELQRALRPLGHLEALGKKDFDLENLEALPGLLYSHSPAVIINAAAYRDVDRAETDEAQAFRINAQAVETMAHYARYNGALLVHYSSDMVFDGTKDSPYIETDRANPLSAYGRSKRAGEQAVEQGGCHHLMFRTSWVYAAQGHNFVRTIYERAKIQRDLKVVEDQFGTPTSAELIADVTALGIAAFFQDILPEGTHHLTATDAVSRYDLARYIVEAARSKGAPLLLKTEDIKAIRSEALDMPAIRPKNAWLDNSQLCAYLGFPLPHWVVHLDRVLDQLIAADRQAGVF